MKIDMHVHTARHSACAKREPEEMVEAAINNGLDGLVFTEHNYMWQLDELTELQEKYPGFKLLRGIEVSAAQGHFLVYGITDASEFYVDMPVEELVPLVHKQNGIVLVAHPCRYSDEIPKELFTVGLDGVEIYSMNVRVYMRASINRIEQTLQIPGTAGTDAHNSDVLGLFATDFDKEIKTESELCKAVRECAFKVHIDEKGVEELNSKVDEQVALAKHVFATEGHLTKKEILEKYKFPSSFQEGVKKGRDMHFM